MIAASVIIMWLVGFGAVSLFFPGQSLKKNIVLKISLGFGAGAGITSMIYFLSLSLTPSLLDYTYLVEPVLAVILIGAAILNSRQSRPGDSAGEKTTPEANPSSATPSPGRWAKWLFPALILVAAAPAAGRYSTLTQANPHGQWDAWGIWNLHARYLFDVNEWKGMFAVQNSSSHPDYPLLIPASIARIWSYVCDRTQAAPIILGIGFCVCTVVLMFSAMQACRGTTVAWVACALLLGAPGFVSQSASQYADIPLAYFLLCSGILFVRARAGGKKSLFLLGGFFLGMACWTKNEGILCFLAFLTAIIICGLPGKQLSASIKSASIAAAGALPGLAINFYYKAAFTPSNDIIAGLNRQSIIERLSDPQRYRLVFYHVGLELNNPEIWGIVGCAAALIIILLALRLRKSSDKSPRPSVVLPAVILIVAGYCFVYLVTPRDLQWHIDTSMQRILMHAWPVAVFGVFASGRFANATQNPN